MEVGDRIKFRAWTRDNNKTSTRVVNGFYLGQPTVSYWSHRQFVVRHHEVLAVYPRPMASEALAPAYPPTRETYENCVYGHYCCAVTRGGPCSDELPHRD